MIIKCPNCGWYQKIRTTTGEPKITLSMFLKLQKLTRMFQTRGTEECVHCEWNITIFILAIKPKED